MGILHQLSTEIMVWIYSLGYFGIFLGMTLESACIPIPSEVIMPFAGYLAYSGHMSILGATIAGTLGNILGSWIAYWIGIRGGRRVLLKYGKYILFSPQHFYQSERWFQKRGEITVFISRLLPAIRTFISLPAGIARMPLGKFLFYTAIGSLPWSLGLTLVGYFLGKNWEKIQLVLHPVAYAVVGILFILVIRFVIKSTRKSS